MLELAIEAIELEGCVARTLFDPKSCPGGTRNPALALTLQARARPGGGESRARNFSRATFATTARDASSRAGSQTMRGSSPRSSKRAYQDLAERMHDAVLSHEQRKRLCNSSTLTGCRDPQNTACAGLGRARPSARPVLVSEM
jgi:hypothetical protein